MLRERFAILVAKPFVVLQHRYFLLVGVEEDSVSIQNQYWLVLSELLPNQGIPESDLRRKRFAQEVVGDLAVAYFRKIYFVWCLALARQDRHLFAAV